MGNIYCTHDSPITPRYSFIESNREFTKTHELIVEQAITSVDSVRLDGATVVVLGLGSGQVLYLTSSDKDTWTSVAYLQPPCSAATGGSSELGAAYLTTRPPCRSYPTHLVGVAWNSGSFGIYSCLSEADHVRFELMYHSTTPDTLFSIYSTENFFAMCSYSGHVYIFSLERPDDAEVSVKGFICNSSLITGAGAVKVFSSSEWNNIIGDCVLNTHFSILSA
jgi:hypothetical protein